MGSFFLFFFMIALSSSLNGIRRSVYTRKESCKNRLYKNLSQERKYSKSRGCIIISYMGNLFD